MVSFFRRKEKEQVFKSQNILDLEKIEQEKDTSKKFMERPFAYWLTEIPKLDLILMLGTGYGLTFGYFQMLINDYQLSLLMALPSLIFVLLILIEMRKQEGFRYCMNAITNYVNDMVYFIGGGNNIATSLKLAEDSATGEFQQDIKKTVEMLNGLKSEFQVEHFKKYNMPTLDQFHNTLKAVYESGTPTKDEIFIPIKDFLLQELTAQDKLLSNRKSMMNTFYFMTGSALIILPILRFRVGEVYFTFIENTSVSIPTLLGFEIIILGALYFMQRMKTDASVR